MLEPELQPGGLHLCEELILAVEAALRIVANVVRLFELAGVQDVGGDCVLRCKRQRGGEFFAGQRSGIRDDGQHAVTQCLMRNIGQIGGVRSTRVSHQQRPQRAKRLLQQREFFFQFHPFDSKACCVDCEQSDGTPCWAKPSRR